MKKTLLAIAVGATFMAPAAAFAAPKVYGKFMLGVESVTDEIGAASTDADSVVQFNDANNASRLGFKGSEELGLGDLNAIYQVELGIDPFGDETAGTEKLSRPFSERNTFVGLEGGFGTLKFGFYDTPVKDIGAKVDQFNDYTYGDITVFMAGETRNKNLVQYISPKFADMFSFSLTAQAGENRTASDDAADNEKSIGDTFYAAAMFESQYVDVGLAYAGNEHASLKLDGKPVGIDILRLTAMVKPIKDLELGVLVQTAEAVEQDQTDGTTKFSDLKDTSWLLSAGYTMDAWKFKGQYGQTEGDQTDKKRKSLSVGVDYKLSKAFVTQAYYNSYTDEAVGGGDDLTTDAIGLGLVFSF
ncbi:porin [Fontimonas sp. SYSU GA230001]|uniref:porin n=1 Tax=Fontimonas sp. SYSU GA230001 TaxID=3142450 RepID=UPI0032B342B9